MDFFERIIRKVYHFMLAVLGAWIYRFPSKKLYLIGVTGTKGKTTTVELLNSILEAAGEKTALISSTRVKVADESVDNDTENSMPGRFFIERTLRRAVSAKCTAAIIEVTSQGIDLSRHRFLSWDIGVITNIAPEHTEAHSSFEKYRNAKLKFLDYVLRKHGTVFINRSDTNSQFFIDELKNRKIVFLYSRDDAHMQSLLARPGFIRRAKDAAPEFILSDFNKDNIAAAEAVARYIKISEDTIESGIHNFRGVPGRMEFVERSGITAVIDYAHTPESLEGVYKAIRQMVEEQQRTNDKKLITNNKEIKADLSHEFQVGSNKLICVLGSAGGGRDAWKRPVLGELAAKYCDTVVLTNEDPYDEDPSQILSDIKSGISNSQFSISNVTEILDRAEAIKRAISFAHKGDIVIITGKGSEKYIHGANGVKTPWSERGVVENALG